MWFIPDHKASPGVQDANQYLSFLPSSPGLSYQTGFTKIYKDVFLTNSKNKCFSVLQSRNNKLHINFLIYSEK
jgi:hypothetical protein